MIKKVFLKCNVDGLLFGFKPKSPLGANPVGLNMPVVDPGVPVMPPGVEDGMPVPVPVPGVTGLQMKHHNTNVG